MTVLQREKEEARLSVFPDPDLVGRGSLRRMGLAASPLAWRTSLAMQQRFVRDYGLSDYEPGFDGRKSNGGLFDAASAAGPSLNASATC